MSKLFPIALTACLLTLCFSATSRAISAPASNSAPAPLMLAHQEINIPGDKTTSHPYGRQTVSGGGKFSCPSLFISATNSTDAGYYDYGIIKLPSAFSGNPATLTMTSSYSTSDFSNMNAKIIEYDYKTAQLWACSGKIKRSTTNHLVHKLDTLSGMSASPILDSNNKVIGINTYGISGNFSSQTEKDKPVSNDYPDSNKANRITTTALAFFNSNM